MVSARCARTGVQEYQQPDGSIRREYRPPDEVFAADSLDSFRFSTLTVGHPPLGVSAETWRQLAVGHAGHEPKPEEGRFIGSDLYVQDASAARGVETKRLVELSCGYSCDLDMTPGVSPDGEPYDAVQRNIRHNHLALLPQGNARGGPELRIRLDSKGDSYLAGTMPDPAPNAGTRTDDGKGGKQPVTVEVHQHDHHHDESHKHDHQHDELKKKCDSLEGENATLKADRDKAKNDLAAAQDPKRLDALVAARLELVTEARKHLVGAARQDGKGHDPFDATGKSDDEIRRLVLAKLSPSVKLDGKSDAYVIGAYEAAIATAKTAGGGSDKDRADARARSVQGSVPRADSKGGGGEGGEECDKVKDARDGMIQRMKDRGRRPDRRDRSHDRRGKDNDDRRGGDDRRH